MYLSSLLLHEVSLFFEQEQKTILQKTTLKVAWVIKIEHYEKTMSGTMRDKRILK